MMGRSGAVYHTIPEDGIVDDVAVERVLAGHPAGLSKSEKLEVVRRGMMRDGLSITELEERLGLAPTSVSHLVKRFTGQNIADFLGPTYVRANMRRANEKFDGLPPDIQRWHRYYKPVDREAYNARRRADRAAARAA